MDPIHLGHLRSANEIWESLRLDKIWFIPAALPPHKGTRELTPFEHRLNMVRLATEDVPYFETKSIEGQRPGPSYSIETLRQLTRQYGTEVEFFFILGSDAFIEIEKWKEYGSLINYASLVVMERDERDWPEVKNTIARAWPGYRPSARDDLFVAPGKKNIYLKKVTRLNISGTDIRRRIKSGLSIRFLVPEKIRRYMKDNNLYLKVQANNPSTNSNIQPEPLAPESIVRRISSEIHDNKAEDITILDVRGQSGFADFFIIAQGRSTKHVQGIAGKMRKNLSKIGIKCRGIEGEDEGKWILMDYEDVVVHLFYQPVRGFYDLEGLWTQAPRFDWQGNEAS